MHVLIATLVFVGFMAWLLRRDIRERPNVSGALWLPFFWVIVGGTMPVSDWLAVCGLGFGGGSVEEGSPLDASVFFILIAAGCYVLHQRRVKWSEFMRQNRWVAIYLGYCLLATVWSDFPFIALKRWTKLFGQPVMVLVLLTEPDPVEAFVRLMKRFAYVVVLLSILFIKYYPQWGRTFDEWSGLPTNCGVASNKNALGCDCFILCLFFIWHCLRVWRTEPGTARRNELVLSVGFLALTGWLLQMAHSATAIGAFVLGLALMLFLGFNFVDRRRITFYLVTAVIIFVVGEYCFGLYSLILHALGRNETLTDRTLIWHILWNWDVNPFVGTGFESFWLGARPIQFQDQFHGIAINQAHNGYLETYIQIGGIGVFLTLMMLAATYFKSCRALVEDQVFDFGRFRLPYLAAFVVYNWTEAAFRTYCFPFFIFFLIAIDYQHWAKTEHIADTPVEVETGAGLPSVSIK